MNYYALYSYLFLLGGNVYCAVEILYRARTHYSMFFCAGFAVIILYAVYANNISISPVLFALIASVVITCLEFIFGAVFNVLLNMKVWDYSSMPLNLFGQICLPFSAIWFVFGLGMYYFFKIAGAGFPTRP